MKNFVRKRILPFEVLVLFILQKTNQSNQVCLDDFFGDSFEAPSKSAFTQARAKLKYQVFKKLNRLVSDLFYSGASFKKWKGFRVLSVDGSTLELPDHPSMKEKFSYHKFGPNAEAGHWMSRISYLYDALNGLVLDAGMESYKTSEAKLCQDHLEYVKEGDLLLADRYYASFRLIYGLLGRKADFVLRMKDNWWKCVEQFVETGQKEGIYEVELPKNQWEILKKYPHLDKKVKLRLIRKKDSKGNFQIFATSLLDGEIYSAKSIINLYKQRWGVEEAYKLVKSRLEVADFSGKTAQAVQQDFYAKTLLISLCNIMCYRVRPKLKSGRKTASKRKLVLNRTYALKHLKSCLKQIYEGVVSIKDLVSRLLSQIDSKIEYSRAGQQSKRKFRKNIGYTSYKMI